MAFILTPANVTTRLYQEVIEEITRADASIVQASIDAALDEAAGYLGNFDIDKILGTATTNATVTDANLLSKLKELFVWHFIGLANPSIDYAAAQERYLMTIEKYFEKVQSGKITPKGWPYKDVTTEDTPPEGNEVSWSSNKKRSNHF